MVWFFGLLILAALISLGKDLILSGHLPDRSNCIFHASFIIMSMIAVFTRREWFHKILVAAGLLVFVAYIAFLFAKKGKKNRQLRNPFLTAFLMGIARFVLFPALWLGNWRGKGDCLQVVAGKA